MDRALLRKWARHRLLFWPAAWLPAPLAYRSAQSIGRWDCHHRDAARVAVGNGLLRAWPELRDTPEQLEACLCGWFAMQAREMMDTYRLPQLNRARIEALVSLEGEQHLLDTRDQGRGSILVMAHFSRLTMLLARLGFAGISHGMLTMPIDERNPELDRIDRRYLRHKVTRLIAYMGGRWFSVGESMRPLYQALGEGQIVVVLLDADVGDPRKRQGFPFLGGTLEIATGITRLAQKTGARLVYGTAIEEGWRLRGQVRPLPDDPEHGLAAAVSELEKDVRAWPAQWWHWNVLDFIWQPAQGEEVA